MCLGQMVTALTALMSGAGAGGAPCQGGAVTPVPAPAPCPMPMPYPAPYPMPYPEQVIVQPSSCGGTYPCKDKPSKGKKKHDKKHQDKKQNKEEEEHEKRGLRF